MSYFPDSDLHKVHARQFFDTPSTPTHGPESLHVGTSPSSRPRHDSDPDRPSWESQKTHGLGIFPVKPFDPMHPSFSPQAPTPTSWAWSAYLPPESPAQNIPQFRREMWIDTPASNVASEGMWSALPMSTVELRPTDIFDHSDYSTTSCATSVYSSPYTASAQLDGSHGPFIKLESPFEASHSPGSSHYEQPMVVDPRDIVTRAPSPPPKVVFTPLLTSLTPRAAQSASPQPVKRKLEDEDYETEKPPRKQRAYTTPEDATCSCKQCGKLFNRASNLVAHMQTHETYRDQPWACRYDHCNKRFNRRTDMERHARSVHIKDMSHKCEACQRCFGRKDTLTRHELAGCPRREVVNPTTGKRRSRASRRKQSVSQQAVVPSMSSPVEQYTTFAFES